MTNAKSSQNHSVSATEMCDAIVTKLWSDRVQFIRTASVPFSLPEFEIVLCELSTLIIIIIMIIMLAPSAFLAWAA